MMVGVWLASLLLHGGSASYAPVMFLFQHFLDTVVVFFPRWRSSNPDSLAPSATLPFPCRPTRRNLDVRRTRLSASIATARLLFSRPRRHIPQRPCSRPQNPCPRVSFCSPHAAGWLTQMQSKYGVTNEDMALGFNGTLSKDKNAFQTNGCSPSPTSSVTTPASA